MSIARHVSDFLAIPIQFPPSTSFPSPTTHYIYLRPDRPKISTPSSSRTLFLVNIPISTTAAQLENLFITQLSVGLIENIVFPDSPIPNPAPAPSSKEIQTRGGNRGNEPNTATLSAQLLSYPLPSTTLTLLHPSRQALITFLDRSSLLSALKMAKKYSRIPAPAPLPWSLNSNPNSESKRNTTTTTNPFLTRHALSHPPRTPLLSSINAYMTLFSQLETTLAQEASLVHNSIDADGFTIVGRSGGKVKGLRRGKGEEVLRKEQERAGERKRKRGEDEAAAAAGDGVEGGGFYRFQWREKRRREEERVKEGLERDRRRVGEMRRRRIEGTGS